VNHDEEKIVLVGNGMAGVNCIGITFVIEVTNDGK
jgi:NAD(P)H-nitrite reductase large subunit